MAAQNGGSIEVTCQTDGKVVVGDGLVLQADVLAENGVVHGISEVLVPSIGIKQTQFKNNIVGIEYFDVLLTNSS